MPARGERRRSHPWSGPGRAARATASLQAEPPSCGAGAPGCGGAATGEHCPFTRRGAVLVGAVVAEDHAHLLRLLLELAFELAGPADGSGRQHLLVDSGQALPSPLGRPDAGCSGRGEPPRCSGGALGCVGAPQPFRWCREADGALSSDRAEATFHERHHVWRVEHDPLLLVTVVLVERPLLRGGGDGGGGGDGRRWW